MSINKVCISGNLGHDPELKTTQNGTSVCSFSVCVNDRKREGDKWVDVPNWVDVVFFGNRGESLKKNLAKGMLVFVSGRLHQNTWEKDGQKRSKLEIVGDDIQYVSNQQEPQQHQPQQYQPQQAAPYQQQPMYPQGYQQQYQPQQYQPQPQQYQPQQAQADEGDVYDKDIPF